MTPSDGNPLGRVPDSALAQEVIDQLLAEARGVARSITHRVVRALGDPDLSPAPSGSDLDGPLRVLCVDDYPDAADAMAAVLELFGCDVRSCYDGPSALLVAQEFHPDVCLLDLSMPGMDGVELAARLHARAGCRPLLLAATTALASDQDLALTALAGFHAHLVKPVTAGTLQLLLDRFRAIVRRG